MRAMLVAPQAVDSWRTPRSRLLKNASPEPAEGGVQMLAPAMSQAALGCKGKPKSYSYMEDVSLKVSPRPTVGIGQWFSN